MFNNIFKNKTVIITGHTGFKGSWLTIWLTNLGAKVVGISLDIPTTPSNFSVSRIKDVVEDFGYTMPFLRPQELAGDKSKTIDG